MLTAERPAAYVAASSRDQARVIFEYAREFAMHPSITEQIVVRHLELRVANGFLRVLASDAPKLHGLTPSWVALDELHAFKDHTVVHFTHPLCSECREWERRLQRERRRHVTVDVKSRPELARKYGIAVVPTVIDVASDGTVLQRLAP